MLKCCALSLSSLPRGATYNQGGAESPAGFFSWNLLVKYKALPPIHQERLNHNSEEEPLPEHICAFSQIRSDPVSESSSRGVLIVLLFSLLLLLKHVCVVSRSLN